MCACMYDYHIAVSIKTLAPFECMCACACIYTHMKKKKYRSVLCRYGGEVRRRHTNTMPHKQHHQRHFVQIAHRAMKCLCERIKRKQVLIDRSLPGLRWCAETCGQQRKHTRNEIHYARVRQSVTIVKLNALFV